MSLPLVLLPGMMCDARLFAPQIATFSRTCAVHTASVTAHDTTAALATEVIAHAPPRFALAGLSMGGIVAIEIIRQASERVAGLALLDTNPRAETPEIQSKRGPQMDRVQDGALAEVIRDEFKPNYLADGPNRQPVLDLCMDMALSLGPDVFLRQSRALRDRPDRQGALRAVRVPTLILCGRDDRLCPVERHELMHDLVPGSQLAIIDDAGHMPTLEQPEATTAELVRWFQAI